MRKKRSSGKRHCEGAPQGRPKQSQKRDCFVGADVSKGLLAMTLGFSLATLLFFGLTNARAQDTLTMDLKGIEVVELFKILSMKMDKTIVPTKSVSGRVNIFLNNLTFDDALDVILVSQDLACEKKGNIINIMTSNEYEKLYGRKYNEKRKFKIIKLKYAKPQTVFNALGGIKSDIGKVLMDETSGMLVLIDVPENLDLLDKKIGELDQPLETDIFYLDYAAPGAAKNFLSKAVTPNVGEVWVDERTNKVMICDLPGKVKKIRRMMRSFDVPGEQVFVHAVIVEIILNEEYQKSINWEGVFNRGGDSNMVDLKGVFPIASTFTPTTSLSSDYCQLTAGIVEDNGFAITLSKLERVGDVRVISNGYLSVTDKQEGRIAVISKEPVITQVMDTQAAATILSDSIEFVEVGMTVKVTPQIHDRDFITLDISTESSTLNSVTQTEQSYVPIVGKKQAETRLKVKDGTTAMVAGISDYDCRKNLATHPLAPIVAGASLSDTEAMRGRIIEYLIFLTPVRYGKK